jgi:indolepyruvate ferredoxin oxidoreductase beta subunit
MRQNIIIAGVGGQGILTIGRVLSSAAMARGLNVKLSEIHGMSQRGGAVYSHLRFSESEIFSDLIPAGQADLVLGIEPLETLRYVSMLREGGTVVASTNAEVNIADYPPIEEVLAHLAVFPNNVTLDMEKLARAAGGVLSANIVALGAASIYIPFTVPELQCALAELFAAKGDRVVQSNMRALRFGRTAAAAYREAIERNVDPRKARGWISTLSPEHLASEEDLDFTGLAAETDVSRLTGAEAYAFESLLKGAYDEGRSQLYEHEVYRLIELVGAITPPRHVFISRESTVSEDVLRQFPGERVVLKLVSCEVVHKTEAEAVVILPKEIGRVRHEIGRMIARFPSGTAVAGVLLVEYVEHDASGFGSELFVGIRATREFGPVIAAGLGGIQTEYLAAKMRPGVAVAKVLACETDAEQFLCMFKRTAAYDVLSGHIRGHERVVSDGELLRCFRAFISIARQFCIDRGAEGPDVGELEVNPFAFSGQRLIPLDGHGFLKTASRAAPPRPPGRVGNLLEPLRIGLIGVSSAEGGLGRIMLANILREGTPATNIIIVKPGHDAIDGVRCIDSIGDLEEPIDLLLIAVPAPAVPAVMREANGSGKVRSAIIISGGAGEAAGSETIGEQISAAVKEGRERADGGTVFLGPNCMGVRSLPGHYDTFFIPEDKLPHRVGDNSQPLAIISQSGAFIVSRLSSYAHLRPRFAVSIGNQCDITVSDLLHWMAKRNDIKVVAVYLEGFADLDGVETMRACSELRSEGKSVIFYKAGRTESGQSAAAGHTAAVAGDYDICQTAMRQFGAFVAQDFREFGQAVELATCLAGRCTRDGSVFAVTNAGMEAVAMADAGADFAPLTPHFESRLRQILKDHGLECLVGPRNPLDLTPMASELVYDDVVRAALSESEVGAVIVSCVPLAPSLKTLAEDLTHPSSFVGLAKNWIRESEKAVVFAIDGGPEFHALASALRQAGLPVFRSSDEAARVLTRWVECGRLTPSRPSP